jgi:hypothetical protein
MKKDGMGFMTINVMALLMHSFSDGINRRIIEGLIVEGHPIHTDWIGEGIVYRREDNDDAMEV